MIIRPASNDGVQYVNEVFLFPCLCAFDHITDFTDDSPNRFLGWLYQKLSSVFTEVPAQKVKAVIYMSNVSLLIGQFQTPFHQELFNQLSKLLSNLF